MDTTFTNPQALMRGAFHIRGIPPPCRRIRPDAFP